LSYFLIVLDPRWAKPIKDRVRQNNQAKAINEVVNALKPSQSSKLGPRFPQLRVVNGISTPTSSILTTAAQENFPISPADGLPGHPGNSTIRWGGGLQTHPEVQENEDPEPQERMLLEHPSRDKPITPSLATLEKAVSARIYFENLYFPLLRHAPSREQRRLAMEKDMSEMQLNEGQKEILRARWRQNETDYLRDQRRKVNVSAFRKLKTIGHGPDMPLFPFSLIYSLCASGAFGVVSLVKERSSGQLYAMKEVSLAQHSSFLNRFIE
jgi:protein-serine/threonine kinase